MKRVLEVCSPSVDFALAAEAAGADRIELCDNLAEGGTTPSAGAIEGAVALLEIPVMVMIRPRGGDFVYSPSELDIMRADIDVARERGAHGVVLGVLATDGSIPSGLLRELVERAAPLPVTFHRAFDLSRDLDRSLDVLLEVGVHRLLTSVGHPAVTDDLAALERLARRAGEDLVVMPGGGIRSHNVARVLSVPGIREVHIGASRWTESPMEHRVPGVPMGRASEPDEYRREEADTALIAGVARHLHPVEAPA